MNIFKHMKHQLLVKKMLQHANCKKVKIDCLLDAYQYEKKTKGWTGNMPRIL